MALWVATSDFISTCIWLHCAVKGSRVMGNSNSLCWCCWNPLCFYNGPWWHRRVPNAVPCRCPLPFAHLHPIFWTHPTILSTRLAASWVEFPKTRPPLLSCFRLPFDRWLTRCLRRHWQFLSLRSRRQCFLSPCLLLSPFTAVCR